MWTMQWTDSADPGRRRGITLNKSTLIEKFNAGSTSKAET